MAVDHDQSARALAPASDPAPYRPPDAKKKKIFGQPKADKSRPWLALKDGETEREWQRRINRTCWRCGHYEDDIEALDEHEAGHGR